MALAEANAMLTNDEIKDRSQEICDRFREIGLMAVVPARGPLGPNVFSMGLDPSSEVFRFWVGGAKVDIVDVMTEPKKQAVVRIAELEHVVEIPFVRKDMYFQQDTARFRAEDYVSTNFPTGTTYKWKSKLEWIPKRGFPNSAYKTLTGTILATVPTFDNSFLMGYDEVKCFISQLPQPVRTVAQAHKLLRPTNILKTSVRQGEWFFTPCSKAEIASIEQEIVSLAESFGANHRKTVHRFLHHNAINIAKSNATPITPQSSHRAMRHVKLDDTIYVDGSVVDNRNGRHETLVLDKWHRVTRNNEVPETATTNGSESMRRTRWD